MLTKSIFGFPPIHSTFSQLNDSECCWMLFLVKTIKPSKQTTRANPLTWLKWVSTQQRIGIQVNIPVLMSTFLPAWFISSWFLPALCLCLHLATMLPIMTVIALSLSVTNCKVVLSCSHAAFPPRSPHVSHPSAVCLLLGSLCMVLQAPFSAWLHLEALVGHFPVSLDEWFPYSSVSDLWQTGRWSTIYSKDLQHCTKGVSFAAGTFMSQATGLLFIFVDLFLYMLLVPFIFFISFQVFYVYILLFYAYPDTGIYFKL